ncbi:MAG TPA: hypothetical protein VGQ59_10235 [Cyclobacteriaceae bacterium]|jgi:DNA-binding transcriptional ArsR family regulator|nr:hypothetical protein [Cyclobacteriaceae bacterium]
MKDSLEKFVEQNREAFDDQMPPENAWKKIENSLPKISKQIFWNSVSLWRAAAIIFFGLSAYLLISKNYSRPNKQEIAEIQGFNDLETYYSSQISEKMEMVHRYQSSTGLTEDEITQNLKKLEAMYLVLKDEMKRRPSQDVRDALVLNLLVRIDLINQQLNKLDKPTLNKLTDKKIQS